MFESLNTLLNTILIGLAVGFLPSVIWLLFWLRQDKHPEPKKILVKAFFYGMLAVPFAIVLELWTVGFTGYGHITDIIDLNLTHTLVIVMIMWSIIEEGLKFFFASRELIQKDDDEPVDPVIYMITAALGFAALENFLFIISPLLSGDFSHVAAATQMRFIGATLLHILASGIIGLGLGYAFYKTRLVKIITVTLAICGAIALHAAFNIFIMLYESHIFLVFAIMWAIIIGFIFSIEKLKYIKKPNNI